jgi:hypothetical protein
MLPVPKWKMDGGYMAHPSEEDLFDHANSNAFHFSDVVGYHVKWLNVGS